MEFNEEIKEKTTETGDAPANQTATTKVIELVTGDKADTKKTALPAPKQNIPKIDFDIFVPRVKLLKGKSIDTFSDEEIIELALNKLTCDSYKSLKGIENTPAIACWVHLYNAVEDGNIKLAKAICNLKKDFPGAMKFMLNQVKKIGSGGFEHNELFKFVEKYYFTKDNTKKDAKAEEKKQAAPKATLKEKPSTSTTSKAKEKKQAAPKAKTKEKPFTTKIENKEEPLQLSLLM